MRHILIFLFVFFVLSSSCFALDKITAYEGDLIKLKIDAYDLDKDNLDFFFPEPFDENGTWQTGYEDAGVYNITVSVSDGKDMSYKNLQITIKNKDRAPKFSGLKDVYKVNEEEQLKIILDATDPDGDKVEFVAVNLPKGATFSDGVFKWTPDYDVVSKEENFINEVLTKLRIYNYFKKKQKEFFVVFVSKSKEESTKRTVKIIVRDVNRAPVMKKLSDININEGDEIIIEPEVTDPDGDVVKISFSGAITSNSYKSGYDDAGVYKITVTASDGKEKVSQDIKLTIKNKNRAPELKEIKDKEVDENSELSFSIKANDADGDELTYSAEQMPLGADLIDNIFTYRPDFDVTKDTKTFLVTFIVSDSSDKDKQTVKINVNNVDRAPVIDKAANTTDTIKIYTGSAVKFTVNATDPDKDNLTYKWVFGLFDDYEGGKSHIRKFTTPGIKTVKVIVSDGKLAAVKKWKVDVISKKITTKTTITPTIQTKPAEKTYKTYIIE